MENGRRQKRIIMGLLTLLTSILIWRVLIKEDDMNTKIITDTNISDIKINSTGTAITIEATSDENIKLMYSSRSDFHVDTEASDGVLNINTKSGMIKNHAQSDYVLKVYIPENLIEKLDIRSSVAFVHIAGKENMLQSCNIDVGIGALYLKNIYADTTAKTITGAIKLKNESIQSNVKLETHIGVIDVALDELADDVSIYTSGTVKRNTFSRTRGNVSPNERFAVVVKNSLGVVNIH